tara:strand:+ start:1161 stop:1622 length:462 start_codon:yes stop_codon:yes gene_type:complete
MSTKKNYSYEEISNIIFQNFEKIENKNFDCIIAIGSGGLIPAVIIKNMLNIPMYVISVSSYNNHIKGDIKIIQWIEKDFSDMNVLLIDEIDDTGSTLTFCSNRLKEINNCKNLSIFVLHNRDLQKCDNYVNDLPYYECEKVYSDVWINYPWKN